METANDEVARLTALLTPPPPPPPAPPPPAPALLPDLDTLERLVRYETCLARELSRALRELRLLQAAEHAIQCQTNPAAHPQPAAAGVAAARSASGCPARPEASASMLLPSPADQTNPAALSPVYQVARTNPATSAPDYQTAETNPPAMPTRPVAVAKRFSKKRPGTMKARRY